MLGDCREVLSKLPAESVHCCVTSPPYFGLRDYGVAGQIGLEATPALYIERMVEIMRGVHRVLRSDGSLWLNIGDSYASGGNGWRPGNPAKNGGNSNRDGVKAPGFKPKDLIGIPWMLAFALRDDGWYLRRDIIWHKPNPMPESVTDRPTSAHEYLFLLTKSGSPTYWTHRDHAGSRTRPEPDYRWEKRDAVGFLVEVAEEPLNWREDGWRRINLWRAHDYFYDGEAIKEPAAYAGQQLGICRGQKRRATAMGRTPSGNEVPGADADIASRRNKRSVWTITTAPFKGAHFATFPPALVEPCILAGTSERGVCPKCGAPWERVVAKSKGDCEAADRPKLSRGMRDRTSTLSLSNSTHRGSEWALRGSESETIGWHPTCSCKAKGIAKPIVIDPFGGAATTALTASKLGRIGISIELSGAYHDIACERIEEATRQAEILRRAA